MNLETLVKHFYSKSWVARNLTKLSNEGFNLEENLDENSFYYACHFLPKLSKLIQQGTTYNDILQSVNPRVQVQQRDESINSLADNGDRRPNDGSSLSNIEVSRERLGDRQAPSPQQRCDSGTTSQQDTDARKSLKDKLLGSCQSIQQSSERQHEVARKQHELVRKQHELVEDTAAIARDTASIAFAAIGMATELHSECNRLNDRRASGDTQQQIEPLTIDVDVW